FAVVAREDPVPGAEFMIDEMSPAVVPNAFVPLPVFLLTGALSQQCRGRQRLGLHPKIFVAIANTAIRGEAVHKSAVLVVPCMAHRGIEQRNGARSQPLGFTSPD